MSVTGMTEGVNNVPLLLDPGHAPQASRFPFIDVVTDVCRTPDGYPQSGASAADGTSTVASTNHALHVTADGHASDGIARELVCQRSAELVKRYAPHSGPTPTSEQLMHELQSVHWPFDLKETASKAALDVLIGDDVALRQRIEEPGVEPAARRRLLNIATMLGVAMRSGRAAGDCEKARKEIAELVRKHGLADGSPFQGYKPGANGSSRLAKLEATVSILVSKEAFDAEVTRVCANVAVAQADFVEARLGTPLSDQNRREILNNGGIMSTRAKEALARIAANWNEGGIHRALLLEILLDAERLQRALIVPTGESRPHDVTDTGTPRPDDRRRAPATMPDRTPEATAQDAAVKGGVYNSFDCNPVFHVHYPHTHTTTATGMDIDDKKRSIHVDSSGKVAKTERPKLSARRKLYEEAPSAAPSAKKRRIGEGLQRVKNNPERNSNLELTGLIGSNGPTKLGRDQTEILLKMEQRKVERLREEKEKMEERIKYLTERDDRENMALEILRRQLMVLKEKLARFEQAKEEEDAERQSSGNLSPPAKRKQAGTSGVKDRWSYESENGGYVPRPEDSPMNRQSFIGLLGKGIIATEGSKSARQTGLSDGVVR